MLTSGINQSESPSLDIHHRLDQPPIGDRNRNPRDLSLRELLAEDLRTHDHHWFSPGFIAIATHRLANARWDIRWRVLRFPVTLFCRILRVWSYRIDGIELPYSTQVGRRVRIWHQGGMVLGARSIGNDVHIRQNTTFGVHNREEPGAIPIIGNNVELGPGVCVIGAITVGDSSNIAPNSLVIRDVPAGSVWMGVPARQSVLRTE
jgi:serine O-acetyltransferase